MSDDNPGLPRDYLATTRAGSFGAQAELYDRVRPGYPDVLAGALCKRAGLRVLDVGCGTGKSAAPFVTVGCKVLGIDPDPRMASIAARGGLEVEVASFEEWEAGDRRFDLIIAGQAWHWIDPAVGAEKAAGLLEGAGRLVPFWNYRRPDEEMYAVLEPLYRRHAPALLLNSPLLGTVAEDEELARYRDAIETTGRYREIELLRFAWSVGYTKGEWLDLTRTQSDHHLLGPALGALLADLDAALDDREDWVVDYETAAVVAEIGP